MLTVYSLLPPERQGRQPRSAGWKRVRCWGSNEAGQLGDGTTEDSNVPVGIVPW